MENRIKKYAFLLPLSAGICWGGAGIFVRSLSEYGLTNGTITCLRMFFSVILIAAWIFLYDRSLFHVDPHDLIWFAACGAIGIGVLNVLYNVAVLEGSLAIAAVLLAMSPILVLFSATIFLHEKITKQKLISIILAFTGCVLVSGIFEAQGLHTSKLGFTCGVLAAACYAANSIFSKKIAVRQYHFLTINLYCSAFAGIALIPLASFRGSGRILLSHNFIPLIVLILHAFLTTVFPYGLYFLSMKYLEAGKVAILASSEPPSAMLFGLFVYGEIPSMLSVLGLFISVAAMIMIGQNKEKGAVKKE